MSEERNAGYTIIASTVIGSARFVVGENQNNKLVPYVTWQANIRNDSGSFFWGHYCSDKLQAMADYGHRIADEAERLIDLKERSNRAEHDRAGKER